MTKRMPPIPPEQRSDKGPGGRERPSERETVDEKLREQEPKNLEQQDQQGNTYQNTRHQGYQQDR